MKEMGNEGNPMQASHLFDLRPGEACLLLSPLKGTDEEPRAQERKETAQRNPSVKCFLTVCSPTLASMHDHWKSHSLDQTDLCWQSKHTINIFIILNLPIQENYFSFT